MWQRLVMLTNLCVVACMYVCTLGQQKLHHLCILVCADPHQTREALQCSNTTWYRNESTSQLCKRPSNMWNLAMQCIRQRYNIVWKSKQMALHCTSLQSWASWLKIYGWPKMTLSDCLQTWKGCFHERWRLCVPDSYIAHAGTHDDCFIGGKLSSPHCPLQGPHEPHVTAAPSPPLCVRAKLPPTALSALATTSTKILMIIIITITTTGKTVMWA